MVAGEALHRVAQRVDILAKPEIEATPGIGNHCRSPENGPGSIVRAGGCQPARRPLRSLRPSGPAGAPAGATFDQPRKHLHWDSLGVGSCGFLAKNAARL